MNPIEKGWWGPRIWRILHSLAEISDRRDCALAWHSTLRATAEMIPCIACRVHFHTMLNSIKYPIDTVIRTPLRTMLWRAHKETGGELPEEELTAVYGGERPAIVAAASELVKEVQLNFVTVFTPYQLSNLQIWVRTIQYLINLLRNSDIPVPKVKGVKPNPLRGRAGKRGRP
jgi:hypothetical protein